DESHSFGAITQGIKEYEILPASDTLALTLFRSVGLLGKDDTPWRPGRASGINNCVVETPDAQMLQTMRFDYALALDTLADEQAFFSAIQHYRSP
ncbi:glycoside hydrolase family 38 C-terminal domain-containing protein, partial [Huaxiibacter chinensis]